MDAARPADFPTVSNLGDLQRSKIEFTVRHTSCAYLVRSCRFDQNFDTDGIILTAAVVLQNRPLGNTNPRIINLIYTVPVKMFDRLNLLILRTNIIWLRAAFHFFPSQLGHNLSFFIYQQSR